MEVIGAAGAEDSRCLLRGLCLLKPRTEAVASVGSYISRAPTGS